MGILYDLSDLFEVCDTIVLLRIWDQNGGNYWGPMYLNPESCISTSKSHTPREMPRSEAQTRHPKLQNTCTPQNHHLSRQEPLSKSNISFVQGPLRAHMLIWGEASGYHERPELCSSLGRFLSQAVGAYEAEPRSTQPRSKIAGTQPKFLNRAALSQKAL